MPWNDDPDCPLHYLMGRPYTCQPIALLEGCEVHCYPCRAERDAPGVFGAQVFAQRWLRPAAEWESRDAYGKFHFPRMGSPFTDPDLEDGPYLPTPWGDTYADVAMLLPGGVPIAFEMANCHYRLGDTDLEDSQLFEHFQHDDTDGTIVNLCDCGGGAHTCEGVGPYRLYTDNNGLLATCNLFHGSGWPPDGSGHGPGGSNFDCTGQAMGGNLIPVRFGSGGFGAGWYGFGSVTNGGGEARTAPNGCTTNANVRLWAHDEGGSGVCTTDYDDGGWYSDPEYKAFWHLDIGEAALGSNDPLDSGVLRKLVLNWLNADLALESAGVTGCWRLAGCQDGNNNTALNNNQSLNRFGASWGFEDEALALEDLPAVFGFIGRCRKSRASLWADYCVMNCDIHAGVVLHRVDRKQPFMGAAFNWQGQFVYPQVNVRIALQMAVRANIESFNPEGRTLHGQPLILHQDYDGDGGLRRNMPFIEVPGYPDGYETIEWTYGPPPMRIKWHGEMGYFSDPPAQNVYPMDVLTGEELHPHLSYPCKIAQGWNGADDRGLLVHAKPSHVDALDGGRKKIFAGSLRLEWEDALYC